MLLHMRGRFRFHIAGISLLERTFAALFFRTVPSATYADALADFLAMERAAGEEAESAVDNLLFIGKCYKQLGQTDKAVEYLRKIATGEPVDSMDAGHMAEARDLLLEIDPFFQFDDEATDGTDESVDTAEEGPLLIARLCSFAVLLLFRE
ncbi:TPR-REGION domain-containing protein [Aphelenchoides fujianensis]|nr:TPR-REGION domain-containing protein [Aphelenchoides fujianensis]